MIEKFEGQKCFENIPNPDDHKLPKYTEEDYMTYMDILKDYESVKEFANEVTKLDLYEF